MRGKAHLAITAITMYPVSNFIGYIDILLLLGAFIGSYLPDYDRILGIPHRHITHSIIFVVFLSSLSCLINISFAIGLFISMFLHLLADSLTKMGLPYLYYPFKYKQ